MKLRKEFVKKVVECLLSYSKKEFDKQTLEMSIKLTLVLTNILPKFIKKILSGKYEIIFGKNIIDILKDVSKNIRHDNIDAAVTILLAKYDLAKLASELSDTNDLIKKLKKIEPEGSIESIYAYIQAGVAIIMHNMTKKYIFGRDMFSGIIKSLSHGVLSKYNIELDNSKCSILGIEQNVTNQLLEKEIKFLKLCLKYIKYVIFGYNKISEEPTKINKTAFEYIQIAEMILDKNYKNIKYKKNQ